MKGKRIRFSPNFLAIPSCFTATYSPARYDLTPRVSATVPLPVILGSHFTAAFLGLGMEGAHGLSNRTCITQKQNVMN